MAPLIPRMDVFEITDFTWFPSFLRAYVQAGLTAAWTTPIPLLQTSTPAEVVARLLRTHLSPHLHAYTFIDFCAGGGGPTPSIERHLNHHHHHHHHHAIPQGKGNGNGTGNGTAGGAEPVHFVLTDLHPHTDLWAQAASQSPYLSYVADPVDAANAPRDLLTKCCRPGSGSGSGSVQGLGQGQGRGLGQGQGRGLGQEQDGGGKKVFRLFNLAFHHFDDGLARRVLRDTVEGGGDGFGIFELQSRGLAGFLACCMLGPGTMAMAPYYAFLWGAPLALFWTYILPVLPFVLVFDGWMSCLRTRTSDEVEVLLRTCGADEAEIAKWEVKSGSEMFMWPVGSVNWVLCLKR